MNRIWSWMEECAKGTLKYGPQAVLEFGGGASATRAGLGLVRGGDLADVAGREAAGVAFDALSGSVPGGSLLVGGVVGCLRGTGDLGTAGKALNRAAGDLSAWWGRARHRVWGESEEAIEDVARWVTGVFSTEKKRRAKRSPPTLEQALGLILAHLTGRGGSPNGLPPYQFEMQVSSGSKKGSWRTVHASWVLHTQIKAEMFGDVAGDWDAQRLYELLATMYLRTPQTWEPGARLTIALSRVGDWLIEADADTTIDRWPVFPGGEAELTRERLRVMDAEAQRPEQGVMATLKRVPELAQRAVDAVEGFVHKVTGKKDRDKDQAESQSGVRLPDFSNDNDDKEAA
jgi:hypothetical protein